MTNTSESKQYRRGYLKTDGLEAIRNGKIDDGIKLYNEYLTFPGNETDDDAWAMLGGAYRRKGNIMQAIKYYEKSFALNISSTYAIVNIVSLGAVIGDTEIINKYIDRAIQLTSEIVSSGKADHWTRFDIATLQLIEGKIEQAEASFRFAADMESCTLANIESVRSNLMSIYNGNRQMREYIDRIMIVLSEYI